jgi:RimJ/RimL family protein N-acetyltransferase
MVYPAEIRTNRLTIRELTHGDDHALWSITSDSDVTRYLSFGPTSEAEARGLIDFAVSSSQASPRTDYALAVVMSDDGTVGGGALVGSCGLAIDPETPDAAEVYFVLRRDVWGQGLASELLPALLTLGFDALAVRRIFGVAHPDNAASARVMVKCGMSYEGLAPDAFEGQHGWRAGMRYAILRP